MCYRCNQEIINHLCPTTPLIYSRLVTALFDFLDGRWTTLFRHETAPHRWLIGRMVSTSTGLFASASRHFVAGDHHLKRKRCGIGKSGMNAPRLEWPANLPRLLWSPRTCPLCKSFEFTEAELQPMDRPLALFSLHPLRCVNYWRRYYGFSNAPKATT